jgi:hypothetical protein
VPVLLEPWTSSLAPSGWGDVLSVPSALAALRASLLSPDGLKLARAAFVLIAFAAICFAVMLAEIAALDAEPSPLDDEGRP